MCVLPWMCAVPACSGRKQEADAGMASLGLCDPRKAGVTGLSLKNSCKLRRALNAWNWQHCVCPQTLELCLFYFVLSFS